jgi:hypothetical protein
MKKAGNKSRSSTKRIGRPPREENQRERILLEAAKVIATVGYERCSLGLVAKNLGLTAPALYTYFKDKQAIFDEIVVSLTIGMYNYVNECVDPSDSPMRQLESLMVAHADYFETHYWRFVAGSDGYGGVSRAHLTSITEIEGYRERYQKLLGGILRAGIKQKVFIKVDVRTTVIAIYSMLNMNRWYRPEGAKRPRHYAKAYFKLICEGLCS